MEVFHEKAAPLFNLISSNTSENRTLAETRDYLLPKLMSGEVEVGDAIRTGPSTA
jgi:type I restriction enzyme S subunit